MVRRIGRVEVRIRRIVAKLVVFDQMPQNVDAETIDPASKPKTHHLVDGRADSRTAPIEVRLGGEKRVIVILSGCVVIFPSTAAKYRQPIVGRPAIRGGVLPDVPVPL